MDELNRIATARTQATTGPQAWGLAFGYDIWANLLSASVIQGSAPMLSVAVNAKNQISEAGFVYDAAGNLVQTPAPGALAMAYDAENRMTTAAGVSYSYDGDGKRVAKSNGKLYWFGMSSLDALVETDAAGNNPTEYIFFGGKRIARRDPNGSVFYFFADHLGSSRVVTNATGQILDDSDFYPFGGERIVVNNDPNPYKFTGKERDLESDLDYFVARYYSSAYGRFLSADPGPYILRNPQTLNRYSYSMNNPLRFVDKDGEYATYIVDRENRTITLFVDIAIYGPGATQEFADTLERDIESAWQGTYTDPETGEKWTVRTVANVEVMDTTTGSPKPNELYVSSDVAQSYFENRRNQGTAQFPKYRGVLNPRDRRHEAGHILGLGDDYYVDTGAPVPGHEGHLMADRPHAHRAARDEIARIAGYVLSRGKTKGEIIVLPGSKSATERTAERKEHEKKKP